MRYAQVIDGEVVNVILWDGEFPLEMDGELVVIPEDAAVAAGWAYAGGEFEAQPTLPEPAATAEQVRVRVTNLMAHATTRIAPLQDAVDMDEASAKEAADLLLWKKYRIALNRVEQQVGFPASVQWPEIPS